jgi:TRAP-type C4-dicarboxylate transport system substrate-binding protein
MIRKGLVPAAVTLTVVAMLAAACGGGSPRTKAGGSEPVTLTMANPYAHLDYEPAVQHFVSKAEELAGDALRIELSHEWGEFAPDAEQRVVKAVAAGEVDLAWVGTRVFDTLGVYSFQALTAPLLVDSYPLQQAVIDSEIPDQMLDAVDELGVTGLAVLAGGLRKPIAVDGPLLGPDDWQGLTVQTFRSSGQAATIRALGATPTDVGPADRDAGLVAGEIHGIENSLLTHGINNMTPMAPYVTLNVTLWPEATVLLANPDRLSSLTDERVGWLRAAAADAAGRSSELVNVDAELAADQCENGTRFAEASQADLAALRDAVAPVQTRLRQDPQTDGFITRIEELKASLPAAETPAIPDGCTGEAPGVAAPDSGADDPSVLNGVYRLEWTIEELVDRGVPRDEGLDNVGVITLSFKDGTFVWDWTDSPAGSWHCVGSYSISEGRVSIVAGEGPEWECGGASDWGREHFTSRWVLTDDQLVLTDIRASAGYQRDQTLFEVFFGGKPWTKVD